MANEYSPLRQLSGFLSNLTDESNRLRKEKRARRGMTRMNPLFESSGKRAGNMMRSAGADPRMSAAERTARDRQRAVEAGYVPGKQRAKAAKAANQQRSERNKARANEQTRRKKKTRDMGLEFDPNNPLGGIPDSTGFAQTTLPPRGFLEVPTSAFPTSQLREAPTDEYGELLGQNFSGIQLPTKKRSPADTARDLLRLSLRETY